MSEPTLRVTDAASFQAPREDPVDPETLAQAATIVANVRREGTAGLIGAIERFERRAGDPVLLDRAELKAAFLRDNRGGSIYMAARLALAQIGGDATVNGLIELGYIDHQSNIPTRDFSGLTGRVGVRWRLEP